MPQVYPDLDPSLSASDPDPSKQFRKNSNTMSARGGGLFARILGLFCEKWGAKYGGRYFPTAADRNQLGRLLQGLPRDAVEEFPRAIDGYLADSDPWIAQTRRHSLMEFCLQGFSKYLVAAPTVVSRREAATAEAGRQWLEMGKTNGRR